MKHIGNGISFDIKSLCSNYADLTIDDFILVPSNITFYSTAGSRGDWKSHRATLNLQKNYDNTNGVLTAYAKVSLEYMGINGYWGYNVVSKNCAVNVFIINQV